jgi:hypothetical protein
MYLGFQWENRYYVYNVLPFGLATSGYIFSKVNLDWSPNTACVEIICPTILAMNLTLKSTIPQLYFSIKLARQSLSFPIRFVVILRVRHLTTGSEDEPVEIYCSWSREEQAQSSTWRELEAVNRVFEKCN